MSVIDPFDFSSTVIIGNGEFPTSAYPLKILNEATCRVVCDGAANMFVSTGLTFDAIVGDGDSMSDDVRRNFQSLLHISDDQETNDQTKAVEYLKSRGVTDVSIVGATGKREDHSLGNVSLLIDYLKQKVNARIYTDYGVFVPLRGDSVVKVAKGVHVSVFDFGCSSLDAVGLKYPIRPFSNWWQGTLNEAVSHRLDITADGYYLLYIAY